MGQENNLKAVQLVIAVLIAINLVLTIAFILFALEVNENDQVIEEQGNKIEVLQERNALLQEERDMVYAEYLELNKSLERESAE